MANPFLRRATEFIRDDSEFLSIVSPEPLLTFVAKHSRRDDLFDVPVRVIGSPGSGKTMMASLVDFRLVEIVLREDTDTNRVLGSALSRCGFTDGEKPKIAAVRLPMESEYRDFWELPYEPALKTKLLLSLIQARAILALFRSLTANKRRAEADIHFIARREAEAQLERIGGGSAAGVRSRARDVERAIYAIGASLLPPPIEAIPEDAREPYQPFEALMDLEIRWGSERIRVKPLIILDDAHTLHPEQFSALFRSLARREIKIGRWFMMRLDALSPSAVFRSADEEALPGLKSDRDYIDIFMQSLQERKNERRQFRRMAADMADRYLRRVQPLHDRDYDSFGRLLLEEPPTLTRGRLEELRRVVDRDQRKLAVADARRAEVERLVDDYASGSKSADTGIDVRLAMVRVLLHRYANRVSGLTPELFDTNDPDPRTPLKADSSVAEAARLHLRTQFERPFHYGLDDLCDASNENAELFLQMAGALVARMETRAIRNLNPALPPDQQESALRAKARRIIDEWSFPFVARIRRMVDRIADECHSISMQPNARLGSGANAVGVPESEMETLLGGDSEFSSVLKFAVAYGAIIAVRNYRQGGRYWCLLELPGPVCLAYGLTLKRGGFLERRVDDLIELAA
jgi:hypothetical protein